MEKQNNSLIKLLSSQHEIKQTICQFLSNSDLLNLIIVSQQFHKLLRKYLAERKCSDPLQKFIEKALSSEHNQSKDKNKPAIKIIDTELNTIIKAPLFLVPKEMIKGESWTHLKQYSESVQDQIFKDQFITENNNVFFENVKNPQLIMFLNRSVVDPVLNFSPEEQEEAAELSKQKFYQKFYQGTQFSGPEFDFSDQQSMLSRQKKLLQNFEEKKQQENDKEKFQNNLDTLMNLKRISVILCFGGYFSIGIFEGGRCIFHQSDHKYVVRQKAGQRQLAQDQNSGSNISSMGSQIRRDQEQKHQENVSSILNENFAEIEKSQLIFLQAPGVNRLILIDGNEPLVRLKHKLRSICITSKKANYTEVQRVFQAITKVYIVINKDQQ